MRTLRAVLNYRFGKAALSFLLLVGAAALFSLVWLPYSPNQAVSHDFWAGPSLTHPLGVDGSGRDMLSQLLAGSRVTVIVSTVCAAAAAFMSICFAAVTVAGPQTSRGIWTVVVDVLIAFPTLLLAMMLAAVFGGGLTVVLVALSLGFAVSLSRILRGELAQALSLDFVTAARVAGVNRARIFWRHAVRYAKPVLITQTALVAGLAPLAESSLTYLGFGVSPGVPSWGRMLAQSQHAVSVYPLHVLWPGLAIMLFALSCFVLGDALRRATDPRLNTPGHSTPGHRAAANTATEPPEPATPRPEPASHRPPTVPGAADTSAPKATAAAADNQDGELLRITDLRVTAGTAQPLIGPLSLTLKPGQKLGLIGASGSGKSLTSLAIAQLLPPQLTISGEIEFAGQNLMRCDEKQRAQVRGADIGYVFQEPKTALSPLQKLGTQMTAALNAHYTLSRADRRTEAKRLAQLVELPEHLLNRYPHEVSGGQRQRAALAAALAADPKLLIADEVTSALDATVRAQVLTKLKELVTAGGHSLIFISHDLNQVRDLVDTVAVIEAGRIVEIAPTVQLFTSPQHPATVQLLSAAGVTGLKE